MEAVVAAVAGVYYMLPGINVQCVKAGGFSLITAVCKRNDFANFHIPFTTYHKIQVF